MANQEPNRATGSGGEGHRAPNVAAAAVAQGQPLAPQPNSASARRQPHRLQQEAMAAQQASDRQLLMRLQIASNVLGAGYQQITGEPELVQHERMLKLFSGFIDAADALSPQLKLQAGLGNENLASALAKRASSRYVVSQKSGVLKNWDERLFAYANTREPARAHGFSSELPPLIDAADEVVKGASENLTDLRRAIALNPPGNALTLHDKTLNISMAIMAQASVAFMRPVTLCSDTCLERVIGERAESLVGQEKLLYSAMSPISKDHEALLTDRWVNEMRPVLKDAATVCLDLVAFAIDITLPEPGGERSSKEIEQARARIDASLRDCSTLAQLIGEWQQDHPAVGLEKPLAALRLSSDLRAGDFVSVLAPSGMHVPAKIQADGHATLPGPEGLRFEQRDGDFHLIDDADFDAEADIETATPSKPQSQKLTKAVEKAEKLLAQDVRKEARQLTACKGLNNPDLVMPAYCLQAEKWQKQAEQMNKAAGRLDGFGHASHTPDETRLQLTDLAGRLREQATTLVAKAQELTSPETRWSLIKAYARPQASQVAELLEAGEVSRVGRPKQLRTGPQSSPIFEVAINLKNDADGTAYPPVWLHLHAKTPMSANAVRKAGAQDFDAVHLKSDLEKNRGANWVAAQRASGRYDAEVHRSPVGADLLQGLMRFSGGSS